MSSVCQVSSCTNFQFTFCPHCSLHICISCLNEHYLFMENDYPQYLCNFQTELNVNSQQMRDEQDQLTKRLSEVIQYERFEKFLEDKIDEDGKLVMKRFQPSDYFELKENFTLLVENHQKFNQLIEKLNQFITDFHGDAETSKNDASEEIPTSVEINASNAFPKQESKSVLIIESDDEESSEDPSTVWNLKSFIEKHMSQVHTTSPSPYPFHTRLELSFEDKHPVSNLKQIIAVCPLREYTFGLQRHHCHSNGITNIPCDRSAEKTVCLFSHLQHYHVLNTASALKIVRAVVDRTNHLDQVDLFSQASIGSLTGNAILSFTGICPLTKPDVYGILPEHRIRLCSATRRKKILLHYHMRVTHHIAHQYATKLVRAVIDNVDERTSIIEANEQILLLRNSSAI